MGREFAVVSPFPPSCELGSCCHLYKQMDILPFGSGADANNGMAHLGFNKQINIVVCEEGEKEVGRWKTSNVGEPTTVSPI